jgi:hypothetical protein
VQCERCGSYVPVRAAKQVDVSPPEEYYPETIHVCPSCTVDDEDEIATDGGFDVDEASVADGEGTPLSDATGEAEDGIDMRVVTLTDARIEALANRDLAIIKTDDEFLGLIHADRSAEARKATEQLAAARGAEYEVTEVSERA